MKKRSISIEKDQRLVEALTEYVRRRDGISFPAAEFVDGKWKVFPEERLSCCKAVSESRLFRHCFSVNHIAERHGISAVVLRNTLRRQGQYKSIHKAMAGGIAYDPAPNPWGLFSEIENWLCARYCCYDLEQKQRELLGDLAAAKYWSKINQQIFSMEGRPLWIEALIGRAEDEIKRMLGPKYTLEKIEGWWLAIERTE